jgi:hypothetical protein
MIEKLDPLCLRLKRPIMRSSFCMESMPKSYTTTHTPFGIVVDVVDNQLNLGFKVVNLYGPYAERIPFWENLSDSGVMSFSNIILGVDLHFTTSIIEVWGAHPKGKCSRRIFCSLDRKKICW